MISNYLVLDLETNTETYLGRKASYLKNDIVAMGVKSQTSKDACSHWVYENKILNFMGFGEPMVLVIFNAAFDLLYLWDTYTIQSWLKQGGKLYDPQLAEYILTGQKHKYPALRDIAVNKYGCKQREKKMEVYWEKGINTCDIPKELVLEDVGNDALDTEQVMLQQVKIAEKEGMFNLIMARMDGLLATIEIEYNGIFIDQGIMKKNQEQIELELQSVYEKLEILSERYYR